MTELQEVISEQVKLLESSRKKVDHTCDVLETYDRRVKLHSEAITEIQDLILIDRRKLADLLARVEKLEAKYGKDVMYQ